MTRTKKEILTAILQDLKRIDNIISSSIISKGGLIIASDIEKGIDEDTFAAMSAVMQGAAETAVFELKQGKLGQIIINAKKGKIITISAGGKAILVVLAKPEIDLSSALLELRRASEKISKVLG